MRSRATPSVLDNILSTLVIACAAAYVLVPGLRLIHPFLLAQAALTLVFLGRAVVRERHMLQKTPRGIYEAFRRGEVPPSSRLAKAALGAVVLMGCLTFLKDIGSLS